LFVTGPGFWHLIAQRRDRRFGAHLGLGQFFRIGAHRDFFGAQRDFFGAHRDFIGAHRGFFVAHRRFFGAHCVIFFGAQLGFIAHLDFAALLGSQLGIASARVIFGGQLGIDAF